MQVDLQFNNIIDNSILSTENKKLTRLLDNIKVIHDKNERLDEKTCNSMFEHLTNHECKSKFNYQNYLGNKHDILVFYNINLEQQKILLDILSYYTPSIKSMNTLIKYRQFHEFFIRLSKNQDMILPESIFIEFLISESIHYSYKRGLSTDEMKLSVLKMCHSNLNISDSSPYIDNIRDTTINNYLANMVEKSGNIYTDKTLENLCMHLPYTLSLVKVLINHGLKLTDVCVKNICKYSESTSALFDLNPNFNYQTEHIQDIILSHKYIGRPDITGYNKFIINGFQKYPSSGYTDEKLLDSINSGYILIRDDLYLSLKYKITFKNKEIIKQIRNLLDKDTLEHCHQVLFYPNYRFDNTVDQNYYNLLYNIYNNKYSKVISILQKFNSIKPDINCLNIVLYGSSYAQCYNKGGSRKDMLKLLVRAGIIITKDIIEKYRNHFTDTPSQKKLKYSTKAIEEKLVKYYTEQHNFTLKDQNKININLQDDISYYYNMIPSNVIILLVWIIYLLIAIYYNN